MSELAYRHPGRGKAHGALVTTRGLLFDPRCHVPRETLAVPVAQVDPADLCKRCWPECGEVYYGDLAPGDLHADYSVPRRCTRQRGHSGEHSRWPGRAS